MFISKKNKIIPQMFDIRPVDKNGFLDVSKIGKNKKIIEIKKREQKCEVENYVEKKIKSGKEKNSGENYSQEYERLLIKQEILEAERERFLCFFEKNKICEEISEEIDSKIDPKAKLLSFFLSRKRKKEEKNERQGKQKMLNKRSRTVFFGNTFLRITKFSAVAIFCFFIFFLAERGLKIKNEGMSNGREAIVNFAQAQENVKNQDFEKSKICLEDAYQKLNDISKEIDGVGSFLADATKYIPYLSKISSGNHLIEGGKDISQAGILLSELA
ncbi:MAG: hypothetical protein COT31_04470, partial [Candidatus Moranbacteria bacterium CG08_land_8_20_14_0_20_34_16]